MMHLDTYADYLRQVEPLTESRAVRELLTTGGPRNEETQRVLRGSLWTVSGDFERGRDQYLY